MFNTPWSTAADTALTRLNPDQRRVFEDGLAPAGEPVSVRCLASAGSGKTSVVTTLLAHGLNRRRYHPEDVVVTTFTKRGGNELKERLKGMCDPALYARLEAQKQVGTFHSICINWLARHGAHTATHKWSPNFNLDTIPNPWDRSTTDTRTGKKSRRDLWNWAYHREATAAGIPLMGDRAIFKNPNYILDDVLSSPETEAWKLKGQDGGPPKSPTWKTDLYQIPGLPLDLKGYYKKRKDETGEPMPQQMPTGRDYLLAIGILRGNAIQPWDTRTVTMTDPENENSRLTFSSARAAAEHFGEVFGFPFLFKVWAIYEQIKKKLGAYDFEDTLYAMWKHGTLAAALVVVDEAQDNTALQSLIAGDIAKRGNGRLIIVGDVKQSVYSFRGASPAIMRDADESQGFRTLELPTNYRSGSLIVDLGTASTFVSYPGSLAAPRVAREPWAPGSNAVAGRRVDPAALRRVQLPSPEDPQETLLTIPSTVTEGTRVEAFAGSVRIKGYETPAEEATGIGAEVASLIRQGVPYEDILLLSRTNRQGTLLEVGLLLQKIPALRVGRGIPFFDQGIVQDILAYLVAVHMDDSSVLPDILASYDDVFMGGRTSGIRGYMDKAPASARAALRDMHTHTLTNRFGKSQGYRKALRDIEQASLPWPASVEKVISYLVISEDPDDTSADELEESPDKAKTADLLPDRDTDSASAQTLLEITKLFPDYASFAAFRQRLKRETKHYTEEQVAKMAPEERAKFEAERKSRVYVGTIHSVKGGEAPFVFLSVTAGSFPSARAETVTQQAEERRLFYVGVTRARDVLTLTYSETALNGQGAGPSSFLTDYAFPFLTALQGGDTSQDQGSEVEVDARVRIPGVFGGHVPSWSFWSETPDLSETRYCLFAKGGYLLEASRKTPAAKWTLTWVWRDSPSGAEYRAKAAATTVASGDLAAVLPQLEASLHQAALPRDWKQRLARWLRKAPTARITGLSGPLSKEGGEGITYRDLADRLEAL